MAHKHMNPGSENRHEAESFEALLLAVGRKKDKKSFIRLFEYFAPRVKSFLMKGGVTEELADELAQETMLTVWNKADSYDPARAAASTWIFTIARNKKIDSFRKSGPVETELPDYRLADESDSPREALIKTQETEAIASALENLPEEQADLIRKSFFEGKSHAEIAAETKIPLGTVKSRIRLALERLRGEKRVKELW